MKGQDAKPVPDKRECICGFKTKNGTKMLKHQITCEAWLVEGVRQYKAISKT